MSFGAAANTRRGHAGCSHRVHPRRLSAAGAPATRVAELTSEVTCQWEKRFRGIKVIHRDICRWVCPPRWWSEACSNRPTSIGSSAAVGGSNGMSVSAGYLEGTVTMAALARELGVNALVNMSQMTVSQMSIQNPSPQQRQHWLSANVCLIHQ